MKDLKAIFTSFLIAASCAAAGASTFATMSAEEVSALLAEAECSRPDFNSASAKGADTHRISATATPVTVNARDLVTKIYGVLSPDLTHDECIAESQRLLLLTPEDEGSVLWLEADGGYLLDYYGMSPDCTAMARFSDTGEESGHVADFGFFFLFPYTESGKESTLREQSDFSGTLLQEMTDMGIDLGADSLATDLFEAVGNYEGNFVDLRLMEDPGADRYILILSVQPDSLNPSDDVMAEL